MKKGILLFSVLMLGFALGCKKENYSDCIDLKIEQFKRNATNEDFDYTIKIHEWEGQKVYFFSDELGDFMLNNRCDTIAQMSSCCRTICDCLAPAVFSTEGKVIWKK